MSSFAGAESQIPDAVKQLAQRVGCEPEEPVSRIHLRQIGTMRQDQSSRWMSFRARQSISVSRCQFEWLARTGPAGAVRIRDAFEEERGALYVKLFGVLPIARLSDSDDLNRGEAMRYLAEIAWAPDAILHNPQLKWQATSDDKFTVSTQSGAWHAEVAVSLNSAGLISEISASDRPRAIGGTFVPSAWRGVFSDYRQCEGRIVPMSGEVGWVTNGVYEPVWRGKVVEWRAILRE